MAKPVEDDTIVKHCTEAVKLWGRTFQEDMCIEECSELIKAIIKFRREKVSPAAILEELVDVQIMTLQMRVIINDEETYWKIFNEKIERLKCMIENAKNVGKV